MKYFGDILLSLLIFLLSGPFFPLSAQFDDNFELSRDFLAEENFFDWKAYQPPIFWRDEWMKVENGMRSTVGSISMEQFYMEHTIRLKKELGDAVAFLYEQEHEEFYRESPIYREAEFRFGYKYYFSIIGFPTYEKKFGDYGFAFGTGSRQSMNQIHFSRLSQNDLYNEKNVNDDRNAADTEYIQIPILHRIQARYLLNQQLLLNLDLKQEEPTRFLNKTEKRYKSFKGRDYKILADWINPAGWRIGLSSRLDHEERWHQKKGATGINLRYQTLLLNWVDLYHSFDFSDDDFITIGLLESRFENDISALDKTEEYRFLLTSRQAYLFWQDRWKPKMELRYGLQAGTFTLKKERATITEEDEEGIQVKTTVGIAFTERDSYRLLINSTWDLDTFRHRQWDGGNLQLEANF